MKTVFLVSVIALIAVISLAVVSAADNITQSTPTVIVNDLDASSGVVAVETGEVVPIKILFGALDNASDVQVSAWIQGHRSDAAEQDFKYLIAGKNYISRLSLMIPAKIDETTEDLTLFVRIESDAGNWENSYTLSVQRMPYNADILFVELDDTVKAGSSVPIDVVIKNLGIHDLNDVIVSARVTELGLQKRAYFGDLSPVDVCDNDNCDKTDAAQRRIFLSIPSNVKPGVYELVVEASTDKTKSTVKRNILVVGSEQTSNIVVPVANKDVKSGESVTYDLMIVNPENSIGVFEIIPETADGLMVTVDKPVVTVKAGESQAVQVKVKALKEGTQNFALNINSDGKLVQRVALSANVTGKALTSNITILTIILAIIFIVLLVVLVVLLTRKPEKAEGLEESYY